MPSATKQVDLNRQELDQILDRALAGQLTPEDCQKLRWVFDTLVFVFQLLENKKASLRRLKQMLFGSTTETIRKVFNNAAGKDSGSSPSPASQPEGSQDRSFVPGGSQPAAPKPKAPGHGRNGAKAYTGAEKVELRHSTLKHGDRCPGCGKGKVYRMPTPAVLVRLVGRPPVSATVFNMEQFRCGLCGQVYAADPPERAGPEKYDATAVSMIALLKYGTGLPFYRLQGVQKNLGIPLPAPTQWGIMKKAYAVLRPVFTELINQAAQGEIVYNDDTTMKILAMMGKNAKQPELQETERNGEEKNKKKRKEKKADPDTDPDRTGICTSGVVSTRDGSKIALFFTGRKHAGENLADVLAHRNPEQGAPMQMCDGLERNLPKAFATIVCNCMAHARRGFVEVAPSFPDESRFLLETLAKVYKHEDYSKEKAMSAEQRLAYHQQHSAPLMKTLEEWFAKLFKEHNVEPNSGLGKAIKYMQKRWDRLTMFLRQAGAPLDNNLVERALKTAILHRKNSLFYKTRNGAAVGDLFMSLIHTCQLNNVNAFQYLTTLLKNAVQIAAHPADWLPLNYRKQPEAVKLDRVA